MRKLPRAALLHGPFHARPDGGEVLRAADDQWPKGKQRRAYQDVHAAWTKRLAPVLARRTIVDDGGHRRILQLGSRDAPDAAREERLTGVPLHAIGSSQPRLSRNGRASWHAHCIFAPRAHEHDSSEKDM